MHPNRCGVDRRSPQPPACAPVGAGTHHQLERGSIERTQRSHEHSGVHLQQALLDYEPDAEHRPRVRVCRQRKVLVRAQTTWAGSVLGGFGPRQSWIHHGGPHCRPPIAEAGAARPPLKHHPRPTVGAGASSTGNSRKATCAHRAAHRHKVARARRRARAALA